MVGRFEALNPGSKCVGTTAVQVMPGLRLWATLLVFPTKNSPNPELFLFCLCSFVCFPSISCEILCRRQFEARSQAAYLTLQHSEVSNALITACIRPRLRVLAPIMHTPL